MPSLDLFTFYDRLENTVSKYPLRVVLIPVVSHRMSNFQPVSPVSTQPSQKGQSLVELALSITLIMFMLLATIDFGFAFLHWITIRDAAQEGAMYGSLHPGVACETVLKNWVRGASTSPVVNISTLPNSQITVTRSGTTPGETITVNVDYYYHILTPMVSVISGTGDITLSSSITNTILQVDASCP